MAARQSRRRFITGVTAAWLGGVFSQGNPAGAPMAGP
ncbi:MAG: twin-arginine translocation signal domain-containing protein [Halioglobus sp.]|nr:twin-arginine translocation signal domain-containing protein [Halioglobus sp.]